MSEELKIGGVGPVAPQEADDKWFLCTVLLLILLVFSQVSKVMKERKNQKLKQLKKLVKKQKEKSAVETRI